MKGRTLRTSGALCLLVCGTLQTTAIGSSAWAALYSGYIGNRTDASSILIDTAGGLSASGNSWAVTGNTKSNRGVRLDWTADYDGTNHVWTYTYTFNEASGALKDIQNFDLQVANDFSAADLVSWTATAPATGVTGPLAGTDAPVTLTDNSGLVSTPTVLTINKGFRWNFAGTATSNPDYTFTLTVTTSRPPAWGDMIVFSSEQANSTYISAWNSNFATAKTSFPATGGTYNSQVAVPGSIPRLTVNLSGASGGGGTVTSSPGGISCTVADASCSAPFSTGTSVSLTATPDSNSLFGAWSGACAGEPSQVCSLSLEADKTAGATFTYVQPVKITLPSLAQPYYALLQDAYNALVVASSSSGTILTRQFNLGENLNLNSAVDVTLKGGYDTAYANVTGTTTVASLTIGNGSLTVENLSIQ